MSRLQSLYIPFAQGHSDEVDEKVLPNGVFADLQNARLPQLGSLRLRRGWRPVAMLDQATGVSLTAIDLHSFNDSLLAVESGFRVATLTEANASQPWSLYSDARLPQVTAVRRVGNIPDLTSSVTRASAAVTADGVYGCVLQQTATQSVVRVFEMASDETIYAAALSNGTRQRKVVSLGSTFGLVEYTGSALTLATLTPTATSPSFSATATLITATVDWWDAATAYASTPSALHLAYIVAGEALYAKFSTVGVQSGSSKQVVAADAVAVAVCSAADVNAHVAYQLDTDEEVRLLSLSATSPYTTAAGPTAAAAGTAVRRGGFGVGEGTNLLRVVLDLNTTFASGLTPITPTAVIVNITGPTTHSLVEAYTQLSASIWGGPICRSDFFCAGAVRVNFNPVLSRGGPTQPAFLLDERQPQAYLEFGVGITQTSRTTTPLFWPGVAPTGDCLVPTPVRSEAPEAGGAFRVALQVSALKFATAERRPSAQLGGALYITGGVLSQWLASQLVDNGLLQPCIDSVTGSNGTGTIANGTYSYIAIVTWTDAAKRTHRSPLSFAVSSTLAGANDTNTVVVHVPRTLRRTGALSANPRVELYRTEAGPGELFYRVAVAAVSTTDAVTLTDTSPDSAIIDEPQLYTQGELGATSGILDMTPARPSSFAAVTKRRLVVGGAQTAFQASQVTFPETPVWFAEPGYSGDSAQVYHDDVEGGAITGAAALDEAVFLGTRERVYVLGGTGPNLAGVGEFQPLVRLPADAGFYTAQSLLETAEGLWFQGTPEAMYLLPRGQAAPQQDHTVQDRLASGIVGCGYEATDNVAAWATSGATLVLRDLGYKLWMGDTLPFTPIALIGHRGVLYAIASGGVVWRFGAAYGDGSAGGTAVALRVTTGAVETFNIAGWGRLANLELLGEFQTAAAVLAEISYDDGLTWTSLGTHTVTGLSAGQAFQRQWYPARQRGGRFRVRLTMTPSSTTAEGCRLTGLTVNYTRKSGPTRLDSAKRR